MDKTNIVLLILKEGGLQPSVVPSPPQSPNLSSLSSEEVQVNKLSRSLFDSWPSQCHTILYSTSIQEPWAILRPSIKSLQLLLIGEGESHCCPSLSTSLEWKRLRCFLDLHAFASLGVQSSMAMTNNELVLLQFPLCTDSFVRESRRFKSFSALFSQFKLKTRVTRPSSVNRAFP